MRQPCFVNIMKTDEVKRREDNHTMEQDKRTYSFLAELDGKAEEEIRAWVVRELENTQLEEERMWECLWYCVEHEVKEAEERIIKIACTRKRKWWVREVAVEYACRMMPLDELCDRVLPTLAGLQMIRVVERFLDTRDPMLIDFVWIYGEYYGKQKMACDALAIKMQDRRGLASFRNHLERRGAVTRAVVYPDPVEAIGEICEVELLDELERLLRLVLKDSFQDRKERSLRENVEKALRNVVKYGGEAAREQVVSLLERYAAKYERGTSKEILVRGWLDGIK